jgi:hypothetical protein
MSSMEPHTANTRVALGDLNVNIHRSLSPSPININYGTAAATAASLGKRPGSKTSSLPKPQDVLESPILQTFHNSKSPPICGKSRMFGVKRSFEALDEVAGSPQATRIKKESNFQRHVQSDTPMLEDYHSTGSVSGGVLQRNSSGSPASGSTSPASSFGGSSLSVLDDSQNTIITEPDSPVARVMALEELRQVRFPTHVLISPNIK